jgi:hypothetical protein
LKQFKGAIGGKKLSDFSLDKLENVETLNKRMEMVDGLIFEDGHLHDFFATYFSEYHDVSPSQAGHLAEETSVCKMLEIVGTYLLSAKDVESERKIEYKFWKSERDYKKSMESSSVNTSSLQKNVVDDRVEVIDMFVDKKNDKNQKIVRDVAVSKKDIKEIEEIGNLERAIEYIKSPKGLKDVQQFVIRQLEMGTGTEEDRARLKYIANNTERYLKLYTKSLKENQLLIKKAIKKPLEFKSVMKDEGADRDFGEIINLDNLKEIQILLEALSNRDLMGNDFQLVLWDLHAFLYSGKISLTARQQEIINLLSDGWKQTEIADSLGMKKGNVSREIAKVSIKIKDNDEYCI